MAVKVECRINITFGDTVGAKTLGVLCTVTKKTLPSDFCAEEVMDSFR